MSNYYDLKQLACESLRDPRIANYFSRDHVKRADVLRIFDVDKVYAQCMDTDAFRAYAAQHDEVYKLDGWLDKAINDGYFNWKTGLITVAVLSSGFLILNELGDKVYPGFKLLFIVFSAAAALGAGRLAGVCAHDREFHVTYIAASFALLTLSVCTIALAPAFAAFSWHPVWPYFNLACGFAAGVLLSEKKTTRDGHGLARTLLEAIGCMLGRLELRKRKEAWLEHSLTAVIYPNAVMAINRLLGEDSTKLLVEQGAEGLRRLQDPGFTVFTKSEDQLRNLVDGMDGGSIAVTGPRGAGKTTLLRRVCDPQEELLSLYISAPAEYVARDFLAELFQQVCDAYLQRYDSPVAGMRYRGLHTHRDTVRVVRAVVTSFRLAIRVVFVLVLLAVAFGPLFTGVHLPTSVSRLPVGHWRGELAHYARAGWGKYHVAIQIAAGFLALLWWPRWRLLRRLDALRRPRLIKRARNYSIHLKIERTASWGANLSLPTVRGASLSLSKGISENYVPWTLPELVSKLRGFIAEISQPTGGSFKAVVIGIDEIDRIGSIEQAERFIGEIKAVFGIPRCFFLVSVAEDVGFLFSRRSIVGQSALEHSFDDVVVVDALELDEARDLLSTRVPGFTDSFVFLALALSGGLPREMIKVARRLVDVNREARDQPFPRIGDLAFRLVAENVTEVLRTSRSQLARLSLPDAWGDVFCQLRDAMVMLRIEAISPEERRKIIGGLCSLQTPDAAADQAVGQEADEAAAERIVCGLTAFAWYSITVIEAFDNDYFDLHAARASTRNATGGSYAELAAARLELGISPESSQSIIRRFRAHSGLPPLPSR